MTSTSLYTYLMCGEFTWTVYYSVKRSDVTR